MDDRESCKDVLEDGEKLRSLDILQLRRDILKSRVTESFFLDLRFWFSVQL